MLTLLARGGPPDSGSGRNPLMAPSLTAGRPLTWPAAAMRDDPVWLLPWRCWRRRTTQPVMPSPSTVSTTPTALHSGLRAIVSSAPVKAQTSALCSSQASSGSAGGCGSELGMAPPAVTTTPCRCGAGRPTGWFGTPSKPPSAVRAEQPWPGTVAGGAAASQGTCSDDAEKNAISRRGVAASRAPADAVGRPALPSRSGDIRPGRQRRHSVVEGGCCGVGMSDRRGRVW
jgi:hypothetical protein